MSRRTTRRCGLGTLATLLTLGAPLFADAAPLAAQSRLEDVERLTRLGRAEEARTELMAWWEGDRSEASRRDMQRALWLRGRLTVDPVQAELDFQRLVLLYPSGPFTADAVLRLAQASWAMGDGEGTERYMATLEQDYRRTEAWERAQSWLADAGPLPPPGDVATRPDPGRDAAERPPETTPPPRTTPPPPERDVEPGAEDAPSGTMNYYVQLGAFADEARAIALYEEVAAQDVDARVVRVVGSQFTHVRVGRFAERSAAVALLEALTARGINAALVRDDRAERPVGN